MPNRHPGGGLQALAFEAHRRHDAVGDLSPLVVGEEPIPGWQRQRDVPDVPAGRVLAVGIVGGIERCPEVGNLSVTEGVAFFGPQGYTCGDDPLVAVLVCLAGPEQIADEAPTRGPLGDLPDHGDSTSKVEASTSALSETTPVALVTTARTDSI